MTEIPEEDFAKINAEIKKNRIKKLSEITRTNMRKILKRIKLNKYYEHIPHIINKISGILPINISRETEETFRNMFKIIQEPFKRHKPKNRKNFLSYSYVLNKFCRILELDRFCRMLSFIEE